MKIRSSIRNLSIKRFKSLNANDSNARNSEAFQNFRKKKRKKETRREKIHFVGKVTWNATRTSLERLGYGFRCSFFFPIYFFRNTCFDQSNQTLLSIEGPSDTSPREFLITLTLHFSSPLEINRLGLEKICDDQRAAIEKRTIRFASEVRV